VFLDAEDAVVPFGSAQPAVSFDGNNQRRVRLWHWCYIGQLDDADLSALLRSRRLDWVVVPLPEHG
jgi:hypothetical protein